MFKRIFGQPENPSEELSEIPKGMERMGVFNEQDIFIAGFPKSGNTWMQHLMTGVNFRCDMSGISNLLVRDLVPDSHVSRFYKRYQERMIFKTHALPRPEYRNAIFLVRDPRDAINSFRHMETGMGKSVSIREVVDEKKGLMCGWNEHVESWSNNPFKARVIVIKYEDLIANAVREIGKICEYFDLRTENSLIQQIVKNCSFDKMRQKEQSGYWGKNQAWKEGKYFVRKGKAGSYAEDLTSDEIRIIENTFKDMMIKFGYAK